MTEVMSNVRNAACFCTPITKMHNDVVIKIITGVQLPIKTIENLGLEKHIQWRERIEKG